MARVRATIGVVQKRPIFTPGVAKAASSAAMARSQVATSWQPAAVAIPCTSAITGCGIDCIFCISSRADIEDAAVFVDVAAGHLAEIVAGAEDLAGGGENHRADLAIAADLVERGDQIEHQFERERVAALRAVQGDDGGRAFVGDLKIHEASFALARNSFLRILPVAVRGSGPNSTCLGHLKCARRSRHQAINSSAVAEWFGLQPDVGLRHLAPLLVGDRDDRDFGDRGMIGQRLLHFDRRDILAARDDDVLHAVAQFDVAVGMHHGEVAGVEPAALERPPPWPWDCRNSRA